MGGAAGGGGEPGESSHIGLQTFLQGLTELVAKFFRISGSLQFIVNTLVELFAVCFLFFFVGWGRGLWSRVWALRFKVWGCAGLGFKG